MTTGLWGRRWAVPSFRGAGTTSRAGSEARGCMLPRSSTPPTVLPRGVSTTHVVGAKVEVQVFPSGCPCTGSYSTTVSWACHDAASTVATTGIAAGEVWPPSRPVKRPTSRDKGGYITSSSVALSSGLGV